MNAPFQWWVAGGWAIDFFLACQTRSHFDIDIAVSRSDQTLILPYLNHWLFWSIRRDEKDELILQAWESGGTYLGYDIPAVWARETKAAPWRFEFLFQEITDCIWTFRYCDLIRHPISEITDTNPQGIPYIRPEIVLLTKAVRQRPVDINDFYAVLPSLNPSQRIQLSEDIQKFNPSHPWLAELR